MPLNRALIAGVILGGGLISGGLLIQSGAWREAGAATASARLLDQVMARVRRDFIDSLSTDDLYRRTATGVVQEIDDPYSVLLTQDRYKRLREMTSGRYAGVGIEIDLRDGFVTVIAPLAGTPADSAGIQPGDRIVAINGKPTHGLRMEEVQQAMRGPIGSKVRLSIERGPALDPTVVTLTRRDIVFHPVQRAEASDGIGYVRLASFNERAATEVRRAVESVRSAGARSLILDMRSNPGGLLEQGLAVADLFLNRGQTIVSTRGRTSDVDREFDDDSPQLWPDMPIVAVVDSGTASAAEIVAGALQDHERAVIVGSPTYGKGSAQSIFGLGDYALKLTTARWFTPDGRTIERDSTKGGITPDVILRTADMRNTRLDSFSMLRVRDPVVRRAAELLDGVRTPQELRARVSRRR
jgi:carboxyl-terminal processing protease